MSGDLARKIIEAEENGTSIDLTELSYRELMRIQARRINAVRVMVRGKITVYKPERRNG